MDNFLGNDYIGRNVSVRNKHSLRMINKVWKMRFKSLSKGFGDYFVNNITKADGSKVLRCSRLSFSRDEIYESMI